MGRNRSSQPSRSQWSPQRGHRSSYEASTMYHGVRGLQDFGNGQEGSSDMEHRLFWSTCRPKQVRGLSLLSDMGPYEVVTTRYRARFCMYPRPIPACSLLAGRGSPHPHLSSILVRTTARMTVDLDWACARYHRCRPPCKSRRLMQTTTRLSCRRKTTPVWEARATATAERVHKKKLSHPLPGGMIVL